MGSVLVAGGEGATHAPFQMSRLEKIARKVLVLLGFTLAVVLAPSIFWLVKNLAEGKVTIGLVFGHGELLLSGAGLAAATLGGCTIMPSRDGTLKLLIITGSLSLLIGCLSAGLAVKFCAPVPANPNTILFLERIGYASVGLFVFAFIFRVLGFLVEE